MQIQTGKSLKSYNTFNIDVSAKYFAEVSTIDDIKTLLHDSKFKNEEHFILGGGSNILFTKDFNGIIIKNSLRGIEQVYEDEHNVRFKVAGGEIWHRFVLYCVDRNLAGVENLSLIPGEVGATPIQNIGAYGAEVNTIIDEVEVIELSSGNLSTLTYAECEFGYRDSIFKNKHKDKFIITAVTYRLSKKAHFKVSYGDIEKMLEEMGVKDLTVKAVSDAVIKIRSSKLPDPVKLGNAGSFFKNPAIEKSLLDELLLSHHGMPHYPFKDGLVKVPAGWFIEQCGWKGKRVGNTGAHAHHALVLINYGGATGNAIYSLALEIQKSVQDKFGVTIEPEVNIV
jgi:UDP-N-acetylmuramate dehydrogenase